MENEDVALKNKIPTQPSNDTSGASIVKTTFEQKTGAPVLPGSSGKTVLTTLAPRVPVVKATRKQESGNSAATGDSSKAVTTASTPRANSKVNGVAAAQRVTPRITTQAVIKVNPATKPLEPLEPDAPQDITIAPTPSACLGHADGLASISSPAIEDASPASTMDVSSGHSNAPVPTTTAIQSLPKASLSSSGGLASTSPPGLEEVELASPSIVSIESPGGLAPTSSLEKAAPHGADRTEGPSTRVLPTGPFRLFDLPEELQDVILEFAYTEPSFKLITKCSWESEQKHIRKLTGKPKVAFPPIKVNEWMVSKKYFRAAAKAWVEAQTSSEYVRHRMAETVAHDRFPPEAGLFLEFGKTFVIDLENLPPLLGCGYGEIKRCLRVRNLICVVHEDHFDEIDRGLAWEIEFMDEELLCLLKRSSFILPSSIEKLEMRPYEYFVYAETDAQIAVFQSNVANLERVIWQQRSKDPPGNVHVDHGRMYMDSKVISNTPCENPHRFGPYLDHVRMHPYSEAISIIPSTVPRIISPYILDLIDRATTAETPLIITQSNSPLALQPIERTTAANTLSQPSEPRPDDSSWTTVSDWCKSVCTASILSSVFCLLMRWYGFACVLAVIGYGGGLAILMVTCLQWAPASRSGSFWPIQIRESQDERLK
jgi:hypothetical protein